MADANGAQVRGNAAKPAPISALPAWPLTTREKEHSRLVAEGKRTDDGTLCSLVLVEEVGGTWAAYPHGAAQLGVRLSRTEASRVARRILGLDSQDS